MRITRQELEEVKERLKEAMRRNRGRVDEMYAILKEVGKRS